MHKLFIITTLLELIRKIWALLVHNTFNKVMVLTVYITVPIQDINMYF